MAVRKKEITRTHQGEHFLFSSYSAAGADCVGVAGASVGLAAGTVSVLDSKDPQGPVLEFGRHQWANFLGTVKR